MYQKKECNGNIMLNDNINKMPQLLVIILIQPEFNTHQIPRQTAMFGTDRPGNLADVALF